MQYHNLTTQELLAAADRSDDLFVKELAYRLVNRTKGHALRTTIDVFKLSTEHPQRDFFK